MFERHFKADLLQSLDQAAGAAIRIKAIIMVTPEFLIHRAVADNLIRDRQHSMGYRERCLLAAASRRYTPEQCSQETVFFALHGPGALCQCSA